MEQIRYVDDNFLPKSGGTFSGNINTNNNAIINLKDNPTSPSSAVNKKYVDDKTSKIIS